MLPIAMGLLLATACRPGAGEATATGPTGASRGDTVLPADAEIRRDSANGVVRWLAGRDLSAPLESDPAFTQARAAGDAVGVARAFLERHRALFRLDDPRRELRHRRSERDRLGMTHVRFDQVHDGIPVWGAELIVHLDSTLRVLRVNGSTIPTPAAVPTSAQVSVDRARRVAANALDAALDRVEASPALVVETDAEGLPRLAYRVAVVQSLVDRHVCVVDAITGAVMAVRSTLQTTR